MQQTDCERQEIKAKARQKRAQKEEGNMTKPKIRDMIKSKKDMGEGSSFP